MLTKRQRLLRKGNRYARAAAKAYREDRTRDGKVLRREADKCFREAYALKSKGEGIEWDV